MGGLERGRGEENEAIQYAGQDLFGRMLARDKGLKCYVFQAFARDIKQ